LTRISRPIGDVFFRSQSPETIALAADRLRKSERIQPGSQVDERLELRLVDAWHLQQPIQSGAGGIIAPRFPGAFPHPFPQLHRRLEQVHVQAQLLGIKVVHRPDRLRCIVPVPADDLSDMRPVLLLDMGVVVLLVWPAPSESDPLALTVLEETVVDELAPVVRWERNEKSHNRIADPIE